MNSFTLSPILFQREKERKICVARERKKICVFEKKRKKKQAVEREESEKTKKMNNELLFSCIGLRFRRVV